MFESVLVATDGSRSVERAVDTALDLAADFDATVHAIAVVDPAESGGRDQAESAIAALEAVTDRQVIRAVKEGDPAREICAYAAASDVDLIALGTRGRGGDSFHLGSVAEHVVEQASRPVLTVRQYGRTDDSERDREVL